MSLDKFLRVGETITLGTHTFEAGEIKRFAKKYDPQRFHVDEKEAENSVFGKLCASGWHTCAMWMRYNMLAREDTKQAHWDGPGERPVFGPSPGFTNLKWMKPVYAGEPITFTREVVKHRAMASKPGWRLATILCEAHNAQDETVLRFDSAVLVKAEQA